MKANLDDALQKATKGANCFRGLRFFRFLTELTLSAIMAATSELSDISVRRREVMKKPLTKEKILQTIRKDLPYLQEKYGVAKIAIYGSFAKGAQTRKSDIDILVQFVKPLGLEFVGLAYYLEDILGRKVDLATFDTLHRSMENPRYRHIAADIERTLSYA